ncbi:MAG: 5-formyltetrahydrofolate cyclo-ligase [Thermoprotei archaeon]
MSSECRESKDEIRKRIWDLLETTNIADFPRPVYGRIPNFKGSREAAAILAKTEEFRRAKVIKVNPDAPQRHVRYLALSQGKLVLVPTPRLRGQFHLLDPDKIENINEVSTISGASKFGSLVNLEDIPKIDLVVAGSVAVTLRGDRVGKGEGYSELEWAILRETGKVDDSTPVATTVHEFQIVGCIPTMPYDVPVDLIATNKQLIRPPKREKPKGLILEYLTKEKVENTPYLKLYLEKFRNRLL